MAVAAPQGNIQSGNTATGNPNFGPPSGNWSPVPPAMAPGDPDNAVVFAPDKLDCIIHGQYDPVQGPPDGWVFEYGAKCPTPQFKDCPAGQAQEMVITLRKEQNKFTKVIAKQCA
ncbi:hypothetical protein HII31_11977 [Pseudocercospora fuligena]|uniref:Uncharacterized protein n=1 Tax=Pseudocercospora fuligena TaxID=685502 RepID=A0A8H6VD02_9PEZI|nr:hypothetical protein HII31_11977 [Pseudocercospora fuligena]